MGVFTNNHGDQFWKNDNGQLHREDGPAVIKTYGTQKWYINGQLHREDGPAIIYKNGQKEWYINDKLHREDGPAYISTSGTKAWYINGKLHRLDGPARIWSDESGEEWGEWWINHYGVTDEIKQWADERNIDLDNLTEEDKLVIKLEWSGYGEK